MKPGIIMTGASGCLGRLILEMAQAEDVPVICAGRTVLQRNVGNQQETLQHDRKATTIASLLGDVREYTLIHCAAKNSPNDAIEDAEELVEANIRFGFTMIEAARAAGCRKILNFGSFWQLNAAGHAFPVNSYAAMKEAFQTILDYEASAHGLAVITLILSDTYGEADPRRKIINQLHASYASGRPLDMSDGLQKIAPVHLDDVLAAVDVALNELSRPQSAGHHRRFFIYGPDTVTVRDLVAVMEDVLGADIPVRWGARAKLRRLPEEPYRAEESLPGWAPQITLRSGLVRTLKAAGARLKE